LPAGFLAPADDTGYVMGVADGMGGHAFGELASMLVLRTGWEQSPTNINWNWIITDSQVQELKEKVEIIFRRMDEALLLKAREQPDCRGMGTTLTAAYTIGREAFVAHVGDSRAYLFHNGKLMQLTRDHTLAEERIERGLPILAQSWYHTLTNCLGAKKGDVDVEFHHFNLENNDQLLLCTDGLSDMVPDTEIADTLDVARAPQETVNALIELALEKGGKDNVSVVLARYQTEGRAAE
jgi:protein phosphatase